VLLAKSTFINICLLAFGAQLELISRRPLLFNEVSSSELELVFSESENTLEGADSIVRAEIWDDSIEDIG